MSHGASEVTQRVDQADRQRQPDQRVGLVHIAEGGERTVEGVTHRPRDRAGQGTFVTEGDEQHTGAQGREQEAAAADRHGQAGQPQPRENARGHDHARAIGQGPAGGPPRPAQDDDVTEPIGRPLDDVEQADGLGDDGGVLDPAEEGR